MTRDVLPLVMGNGYRWADKLALLEVRREPGRTTVLLKPKPGQRLTPRQASDAVSVAANLASQ